MTHGRSHDERLQKAHKPRGNNIPRDDDTDIEAELVVTGRRGVRPPEGRIGPERARLSNSDENVSHGSEPAPTKRAAEHERERHEAERRIGMYPAGAEEGLRAGVRGEGVTREQLDEVAGLKKE